MNRLIGAGVGVLLLLAALFLSKSFSFGWDYNMWLGSRIGYTVRPPGFTPQRVAMRYDRSLQDSSFVVKASAGEVLTVDYALRVHKGAMTIMAWGPRTWFESYVLPNPFHPFNDYVINTTLRQSGQKRITVPIVKEGYYHVKFYPRTLTGSLEATVYVE